MVERALVTLPSSGSTVECVMQGRLWNVGFSTPVIAEKKSDFFSRDMLEPPPLILLREIAVQARWEQRILRFGGLVGVRRSERALPFYRDPLSAGPLFSPPLRLFSLGLRIRGCDDGRELECCLQWPSELGSDRSFRGYVGSAFQRGPLFGARLGFATLVTSFRWF